MNFNFEIAYSCDGSSYVCTDFVGRHYSARLLENNDGIVLDLRLKTAVTLKSIKLTADYPFKPDDLFFINGYQAWTTCAEMSRNDVIKGLTKLTGLTKKGKYSAAISGDYMFMHYPEKPGRHHSFTYTYVRNGDKLHLMGSRSERVGYTVFGADMRANTLTIAKDVDGLNAQGDIRIFDICLIDGGYDEVFDKYFDFVGCRKPKISSLSGYTSWYNYFQKIDEKIILRDLDGLDRARSSVSIFQIDDGYEPFVGDWLECDKSKFPNGMKYIADRVHEKGYLAGLWLAPFSVQKKSKTALEHPDWLLCDKSGKPELGCFAWGGAYTLDIYNPQVRAHLKKVFDTVLNEWGYDMVKLDFLYSQCIQPRAGKSRAMIMCEAMDFLRELVGDKLLLGCGVPLGPCFGVVDACRISCDVDLKYSGKYYNRLHINCELPSAQNAITNTVLRRHLNGRAFINDPDVFFLRSKNLTFTKEQKLLLAKVNNLCGNVLFVSDNAGDYSDAEIGLLRKFFEKGSSRVISAGYADKNIIEIKYNENGEKCLRFNLRTGESNINELL